MLLSDEKRSMLRQKMAEAGLTRDIVERVLVAPEATVRDWLKNGMALLRPHVSAVPIPPPPPPGDCVPCPLLERFFERLEEVGMDGEFGQLVEKAHMPLFQAWLASPLRRRDFPDA